MADATEAALAALAPSSVMRIADVFTGIVIVAPAATAVAGVVARAPFTTNLAAGVNEPIPAFPAREHR